MVEHPMPPLPLSRAAGIADLPGFRTLRSPRFRMVVAATVLSAGVAVLGLAMVRQAGDPRGQFAIDFGDYHLAAQRLAAGVSPYAPEMLTGPVAAQGIDRYRYPPAFAQSLVPLSSLPMGIAASIWLMIQAVAIVGAGWLASGAGGAARSLERLLWCGVAAVLFLPAFDTLWKGNVSGVLALGVALALLGGPAGGVALAAVGVLKLVPVTLVAAFSADRRGLAAAAVTSVVVVGVSVALAPGAWADYLVVLPNLFAGSADEATNLAPWAMAQRLGAPTTAAGAMRVGSLALSVGAVLVAALVARRPGGRPAAVALATAAMLLAPAALWFHYLVVLLPLVLFAWTPAGPRMRALLGASLVTVSLGVAALPLATVGATVAVASVLMVVRPRVPRRGLGLR